MERFDAIAIGGGLTGSATAEAALEPMLDLFSARRFHVPAAA
jgi:hypothetical protein